MANPAGGGGEQRGDELEPGDPQPEARMPPGDLSSNKPSDAGVTDDPGGAPVGTPKRFDEPCARWCSRGRSSPVTMASI